MQGVGGGGVQGVGGGGVQGARGGERGGVCLGPNGGAESIYKKATMPLIRFSRALTHAR